MSFINSVFNKKGAEVTRLIKQGQWLSAANREEDALARYDQAVELDNQSWRAFLGRGLSHYALEHISDALNDLDKCIELNPKIATSYACRANVHLFNGDYKSTIKDCNEVLKQSAWSDDYFAEEMRSSHPETVKKLQAMAHLTSARAHLKARHFEPVIERATKCLEINKDDTDAYEIRAEAHKLLGHHKQFQEDIQAAKTCREQATKLAPVSAVALSAVKTRSTRVKELVQSIVAKVLTAITKN